MRQFKFGIPILGTIALATGLFGCADESHWGSSSTEKGSISLTLSTDSEIKTAKPTFRSENDESTVNPNDLSTYTTVPKPEDFSIKLEKVDESFSKTWTSLQGFIDYTEKNLFPTGAYTLTAYYGEKGKQDFEAPYFEASTNFNVLSDEVYKVNLVAELKNSMVKVNYTDAFKDYMNDYHSRIRTEGRADEIIINKEQTTPAFIEPNNAALTVHFTTKGKNFTSAVKVGEFPPKAKTLHNITLDIEESQNGDAQLTINFSDELEEETIRIDLTDELLTTPAPVISPIGFTEGSSVDMLEGSSSMSDIKMLVKSGDNIKSALLTIESNKFHPSWGNQIDLCKADDAQKKSIEEAGISAIGFGFRGPISNIAQLDLTNLGKTLPTGVHTISLQVIDEYDIPSNVMSVTLDSQPIVIDIVGNNSITYGAPNADVTVEYNGLNPISELRFQTINDMGNWVDATINSVEEVAGTRSFEKKQYICNLIFPENVAPIRASMPFKIYHNGKEKVSYDMEVKIPEYRLQFDAFTNYAYVKVDVTDNSDENVLKAIIEKMYLKVNGERQTNNIYRDSDKGYIVIGKLTQGTTYSVASSITKGESWHEDDGSFVTETGQSIINGDFSESGNSIEISNLNEGGKFNVKVFGISGDYQLKSSISRTLPAEWATINDKTAWSGATNHNTWFIVPSSWIEEGKGVMRTVGYSHNGETPATSGGNMNTKYYCENSPSNLDVAAGEVFLGSYTFDGNETRTEGIGFGSRPSAISFDYEYEPYGDDSGYAFIKLLDSEGQSLGEKTFSINEESGSESITFNYVPFGKPAAKLIVCFKSSNQDNPPIHVPTGTELYEASVTTTNFRNPPAIPANEYKAVATGSVLKIDNVKAHYDGYLVAPKSIKKNNQKNR